jgi:hypothetical protein
MHEPAIAGIDAHVIDLVAFEPEEHQVSGLHVIPRHRP